MRPVIAVGCLLFFLAPRATSEDGGFKAIRLQAGRYEAALIEHDECTLDELLHHNYSLRCGPRSIDADRASVMFDITLATQGFISLESKAATIRLFGDSAIETGTLSASRKEFGGTLSTWCSLSYTRVWIRAGDAWQLVHEHY